MNYFDRTEDVLDPDDYELVREIKTESCEGCEFFGEHGCEIPRYFTQCELGKIWRKKQ